jgi:hypothetical protein
VVPIEQLPETALPSDAFNTSHHYSISEKPVFFGHYWAQGKPYLFRQNVCCLDFSVAKKGYLTAYRMDDETVLDAGKLVYV